METNDIKLGNQVKDIVTGFEGIATHRLEYLDGTVDIGVKAKSTKSDDKLPQPQYVSITQLEKTGEGIHIKPYLKQIGFINGSKQS